MSIELFPQIFVKNCSAFLDTTKPKFSDKIWDKLGYKFETKYVISGELKGCPDYIKSILLTGEIDKTKYDVVNGFVVGPHLNPTAEEANNRKWSLSAKVDEEENIIFTIGYRD